MRSKDAPRKVSCAISDVTLDCVIAHNCIQDVTLQACGFTQATPQAKELNIQVQDKQLDGSHVASGLASCPAPISFVLQVLLQGSARELVVDIACLDSTGSVIARLPAVKIQASNNCLRLLKALRS